MRWSDGKKSGSSPESVGKNQDFLINRISTQAQQQQDRPALRLTITKHPKTGRRIFGDGETTAGLIDLHGKG